MRSPRARVVARNDVGYDAKRSRRLRLLGEHHHDVPNLFLSIAKRTAKKVSSIAMNAWPLSESNV
jgi:hypothetical protein